MTENLSEKQWKSNCEYYFHTPFTVKYIKRPREVYFLYREMKNYENQKRNLMLYG